MKRILPVILVLLVTATACKKDPDPAPSPAPPQQDTLMGWKKLNVNPGEFVDVWFTSKQQGFLLAGTKGMYRTTDEGATWSKLADGFFVNFHFLDAQYGFAQGGDFAYTTNGGASWTTRPHAFDIYNEVMDIYFVSPSTGFFASGSGLYKTTDTGKTWQRIRNERSYGLYFSNVNNGWQVGAQGQLMKTTDGGANWQVVTDLQTEPFNAVIQFTDAQHGRLSFGKLFAKSDDGGVTWTKKPFAFTIADIHFLNNNLGYLLTGEEIHKTTDGGNTWTRVCKAVNANLVELHFTDANNGWACSMTSNIVLHWKQ